MYKFDNKMLPCAFDKYFKKPSHQHGTRFATQNNYEKVRVKNAKEKSLLKFIGPSKWSSIPLGIKQVPSLKTFTNLYRTHLIDTHDWSLFWSDSWPWNFSPSQINVIKMATKTFFPFFLTLISLILPSSKFLTLVPFLPPLSFLYFYSL